MTVTVAYMPRSAFYENCLLVQTWKKVSVVNAAMLAKIIMLIQKAEDIAERNADSNAAECTSASMGLKDLYTSRTR